MLGPWFRGSPATPCWGLGCVCLHRGLGFAPPFLAGVCGVCGWARVLGFDPPFRAEVLGRVWLCARAACTPQFAAQVCGLGMCALARVLAASTTPGRAVGVSLCLCVRSACTLPLLAGLCGVGVCSWARVSAAPRHSWLGCSGVCVCVYMCAVRLYLGTPGWGVRCGCVCLGSAFGCAPSLLAGVLGSVCVCACPPLVCHHSWLGCTVWVFVLGLGFWLGPAIPALGAGVCVCFCARSACIPPFLAAMCGVGVCAWARVSAAPRHSWLGFSGLCVFESALRLYPTTPGWGARCGCVCLGSASGYAPPLLAGVSGSVCVCVRAPLVLRQSCQECAVWVCVLGLGFRLRPSTLGLGVRVCVCVLVRAPLVPRHSWLGCAV